MATAARNRSAKLQIVIAGKDAISPVMKAITTGFRMIRNVGTAAIRALLAPFRLLGRAIRALLSPMGMVRAAIGFLAARGLVRFVEGTGQLGDEIEKLSQKIGVAVSDLNVLRFAAGQSGVSLENTAIGFRNLARQADEASRGMGTARDDFKRLGIELLDAEGNLRSTMDLFGEVAEVFERMPDGARKTAAAMRIFGRSGSEMIPLLNQGRAGMQRFREETERLGVAMTEAQARLSRDFIDALDRFRTAMRGIRQQVGFELFPMLINRLNAVTEWLVRVRPLIVAGANAFASIVSGIGEVGRAIAEWFSDEARMNVEQMAEAIVNIGRNIGAVLRGIGQSILDEDLRQRVHDAMGLVATDMAVLGREIGTQFMQGFAWAIANGFEALKPVIMSAINRGITVPLVDNVRKALHWIGDLLKKNPLGHPDNIRWIDEWQRNMRLGVDELREFVNVSGSARGSLTQFTRDLRGYFDQEFVAAQIENIKLAMQNLGASTAEVAMILREAGMTFDQIAESAERAADANKKVEREVKGLAAVILGFRTQADQFITLFPTLQDLGSRAFSTLASSIEGTSGSMFDAIVDRTQRVREAVRRMVADILRQMGRLFAQRAAMTLFAGALSTLGVSAAGAQETGIPPLLQAARGAVVQNGQHIERFAQGGIVHSPSFFPMRGRRAALMGEAGPEAIMPLKRTPSGELGVRAENAGETMSVTVNLTVQALDGRSAVQVLNQPETRRAIGDIFAGELQKRRGLRETVRNA